MCNLFKNTLNDTTFSRKVHVKERDQGGLNTEVCILGSWTALSLQAFSSSHIQLFFFGVPSETALTPLIAPHQSKDFVLFFYCWRTHLHVLSLFMSRNSRGGEGKRFFITTSTSALPHLLNTGHQYC